MDHTVSIRRSPSVKISKEHATAVGTRCVKQFLKSGGKPGTCTNAIPESQGGVEFYVFIDYHTNRLLTVTITTPEEAVRLQGDVATDPGELQDIATEAFYRTLPHDGQNRVERGYQ
jgi:hypothetical protein